jgi:LPS sulfotransferase NodH
VIDAPLVFRFQVTPFVILFVERAGSTYLITALKSHPTVVALTEKLDALRQEGKSAAEQLTWARSFLTPPLVGRHRAIGFKSKTVDILDPTGFAALLRERRCKIVRLQRGNSVKAVVSTLNARRQYRVSGNWNLLSESTRLPSFEVDFGEFDALLHEREQLDRDLERYVEDLRLPTLALTYEDLLADQHAFVGRTLAFLGVEAQAAPGATLKNTRDDLREAVLNFDALRAQYRGTRFEPMFDEVLAPA